MDVTPPSLSRQGTAESAPQGTGLLNIAGEKIGAAALWDIRFFMRSGRSDAVRAILPAGGRRAFYVPVTRRK